MNEHEINKTRRRIAQFLENLKTENYTLETQRVYKIYLAFFLKFLQSREEVKTLADVTNETLYAYQMYLYEQKSRKKKDKPLGVKSQIARLGTVRRFYHYLMKRGYVLGDPTSGLEYPKSRRSLPKGIMTRKEVEKILAQPDIDTPLGMRDKAILEVLYSTGIRNAELRNLQLAHVDVKEEELRIEQGKGGYDRIIPLGEIAARYVEQYIQTSRPVLMRNQKKASDILFVNRYGGPLRRGALNNVIVKKYVRKAKLEKHITPHSFRHTCATHMLKGRAGLRHIQVMLGHKSLETTQIYTHLTVSDLKKEHRRTHPREQKHSTT